MEKSGYSYTEIICPWCKHKEFKGKSMYTKHFTHKDFDIEKCPECGKKFKLRRVCVKVAYNTTANCEDNNEKHKYVKKELTEPQSVFLNKYWYECTECGDRWIFSEEEFKEYEVK